MMLPLLRVALLVVVAAVEGASALDTHTIMEYLRERPEFSTLLSLLRESHLDVALESPGALYTLFAPTNDAFNDMQPGLLAYIRDRPLILQRVLMNHVLDKPFISLSMKHEHTEHTLNHDIIRFNIYNDGTLFTVMGAPITNGDAVLKNGVFHTISKVILPAEGDIVRQLLVDDVEFEDLTAAMAVTNIWDELELDHITLFAPTNTAFQNHYPDTSAIPTDVNVLKALLNSHIVNGTWFSAGLKDGDTLTTLSGNTITITRTGNSQLNANGLRLDGMIMATNGVIQVVTDVIVPPN